MRASWRVIGWLPLILLTACVASHPGNTRPGLYAPRWIDS